MARMIRPLANLYEQLRRLPGIGSKTAMRLAYHVIDMPAEDVKQLAAALSGAKEQIHYSWKDAVDEKAELNINTNRPSP